MAERSVRVLYCTGNAGKLAEARAVAAAHALRVELVAGAADAPELQGSAEAVATHKAAAAARSLTPEQLADVAYIVTEDVGLGLGASPSSGGSALRCGH